MNPTSLVVPLDLAQKLKAAGFPQGKTCFTWSRCCPGLTSGCTEMHLFLTSADDAGEDDWAAPTTDELLAELPKKLKVSEYPEKHLTYREGENDCLLVGYGDYEEVHRHLPSALALLWLWWREWSAKEERK